jgi:hypothetical protein
MKICNALWAFTALCISTISANADLMTGPITDPIGDFRVNDGTANGYLGANNPALDVVTADVDYDPTQGTLTIRQTMAGPISGLVGLGNTNLGSYSWGINHGFGSSNFASINLPNVLFDTVLTLNPNGTGTYRGSATPAGAITVSGNTLTAVLSVSFLAPPPPPANAIGPLLPVDQWSYNLWPRASFRPDNITAIPFGNAQIADFGPNDVDFLARTVPEPPSALMASLGIVFVTAGVWWNAHRKAIRLA